MWPPIIVWVRLEAQLHINVSYVNFLMGFAVISNSSYKPKLPLRTLYSKQKPLQNFILDSWSNIRFNKRDAFLKNLAGSVT